MSRQPASSLTLPLAAVAAVAVVLTIASGNESRAQGKPGTGEWRHYSGDNGAKKYAPFDQIDRTNVSRLRVAWRRPQVSAEFLAANPKLRLSNNYRSTPIMVGGVLYATNAVGLVEAFDPSTGRTIWTQPSSGEESGNPGLGGALRAVAFWGEGAEARVFSYHRQYLYALNPKTGVPITSFGANGRVDLAALSPSNQFLWNAPPLVVRDLVLVGQSMPDQDSASKAEGDVGEVRAFDVRTGRLRWRFRSIPTEDDPAAKTWESDALRYIGAGNVWAPMAADEELGYVYLPTSSPTNDMYGGHRPGNNLYTSSVVCLDAMTGRRVWHFQTVHHDLFDYDNPASPVLGDITVDGRRIRAIVQVTKQAFAYVLDRVTGEPVWPIEERPVPASTVPGEKAAATQPFPTRPPPFDRQGLTVDDLIDFTPDLRAEAIAIMKQHVTGPVFTPPSIASTGAWRHEGNDPGARFGRRRGLDRRCLRPRDRHPLRPVDDEPVRGEPRSRRSEGDQPEVPGVDARAGARATGPSTPEAAVRSDYGARSEPRRAGVDGAERQRSTRPSGDQAPEPATARTCVPQRGGGDPDAAVRARWRSDKCSNSARRWRTEFPCAGQGDWCHDLGNGDAGRRDRRADDLYARRQAVCRDGDWRPETSGGIRRVQLAVAVGQWRT